MTMYACVGQLFRRSSLHTEMNTEQDLPLDGQSTKALFTSKGVDVTPNKDHGVVKVFFCQTFKGIFLYKSQKHPVKHGVLFKWKRVAADCEASRMFWGKANDQRQSDHQLHWEAVEHIHNTFTTKQIELLDIEGEKLTNDGGIVRRIKIKGEGFFNPNEGAKVHGKEKSCFYR